MGASLGEAPSLVLDARERPHVSYHDEGGDTLKYAWLSDAGWQVQVVDSGQYTGLSSSLTLDAEGYPAISYDSWDGSAAIRYAHWTGTEWQIERAGEGSAGVSLAFDASGRPHVAYLGDSEILRYTVKTDEGWQEQAVDSLTRIADSISMALDSLGQPYISYSKRRGDGAATVMVAHRTGAAWTREVVEAAARGGLYSSLALDGSGHPHLSYIGGPAWVLRYASFDGSVWHIETVDDTPVDDATSLALDQAGQPHIAYYDQDNDTLRYAWRDGAGWHTQTVDGIGDFGYHLSLALDHDGLPHIAYYEATQWDLKYARYDGTAWQIEVLDAEGQTGRYPSLALDGEDHPHISYMDREEGKMVHAWFDGAAWQFEDICRRLREHLAGAGCGRLAAHRLQDSR